MRQHTKVLETGPELLPASRSIGRPLADSPSLKLGLQSDVWALDIVSLPFDAMQSLVSRYRLAALPRTCL